MSNQLNELSSLIEHLKYDLYDLLEYDIDKGSLLIDTIQNRFSDVFTYLSDAKKSELAFISTFFKKLDMLPLEDNFLNNKDILNINKILKNSQNISVTKTGILKYLNFNPSLESILSKNFLDNLLNKLSKNSTSNKESLSQYKKIETDLILLGYKISLPPNERFNILINANDLLGKTNLLLYFSWLSKNAHNMPKALPEINRDLTFIKTLK